MLRSDVLGVEVDPEVVIADDFDDVRGSNFDLVASRLRTKRRPGDGGDSACLRNETLYAIGERTEFTSVLIVQQLIAVARRIAEKDLVLTRHALEVLTYLIKVRAIGVGEGEQRRHCY